MVKPKPAKKRVRKRGRPKSNKIVFNVTGTEPVIVNNTPEAPAAAPEKKKKPARKRAIKNEKKKEEKKAEKKSEKQEPKVKPPKKQIMMNPFKVEKHCKDRKKLKEPPVPAKLPLKRKPSKT